MPMAIVGSECVLSRSTCVASKADHYSSSLIYKRQTLIHAVKQTGHLSGCVNALTRGFYLHTMSYTDVISFLNQFGSMTLSYEKYIKL